MKLISTENENNSDQALKANRSPLLNRVRAVLDTLDLDCKCRGKVDAALERFEALETRRRLRGLILDARHQAERIAALLELVGELDTIGTEETDVSVFKEIACLFEDIKAAAARGAEDMMRAASCETCGQKRT
ncbi:hypothetical protein [Microvirga sp. G4-2]|uniref:hypothetical protein n=1 Tax=Microvirga sp. G4-2 TaxID=3434467 RepID=UPI004044F233